MNGGGLFVSAGFRFIAIIRFSLKAASISAEDRYARANPNLHQNPGPNAFASLRQDLASRIGYSMKLGALRQLTPTTWVTIQTVYEQALGVILFAVQAVVLGPHAFGLFSLVMVFIGFCEFVLGMAASEALISIPNIEDHHFHTMTTANVLASVLLGVAAFLGADGIARVFNEPELAPVLRWMSALPLISAFCAAPIAASKREMRFRPIALRSIAGLTVGGAAGLTLALLGAGVWALVVQAILQRAVSAVVLWAAVPLQPKLSLSPRHFRDLQRFAAPVMLSRTMNWASAQIPRLVLGFYLGATELGLFSLAARLSDILVQVALEPKTSVARVDLRRFAGDPAGLEQAMRKLFLYMSVFCFPLCIGGAAVVPTLFHAWLDPHWFGGIVIAQMMMLMGVPCITLYCATAVLLAMNRQKWEAMISTVQTSTTLLAVVLFAPFGLVAASAAIALRPVILFPLPVLLMHRLCNLPVRLILHTQAPALAASILMGSAVWLLGLHLGNTFSDAVTLMVLVLFGAAVYIAAIAALLPDFSGRLFRHLAQQVRGMPKSPDLG